jgi:hypothetical protein
MIIYRKQNSKAMEESDHSGDKSKADGYGLPLNAMVASYARNTVRIIGSPHNFIINEYVLKGVKVIMERTPTSTSNYCGK